MDCCRPPQPVGVLGHTKTMGHPWRMDTSNSSHEPVSWGESGASSVHGFASHDNLLTSRRPVRGHSAADGRMVADADVMATCQWCRLTQFQPRPHRRFGRGGSIAWCECLRCGHCLKPMGRDGRSKVISASRLAISQSASFPRYRPGCHLHGRLKDNSPYYDAFVRARPPMPSTPQGGSPRCAR